MYGPKKNGTHNYYYDCKEYNKDNNYTFYYNFIKEGKCEIKIIFNNKLISCKELFYNCKYIIEIDLSKFNCSNIL